MNQLRKWSKRVFVSLVAVSVLPVLALTETVDGITWTYTVSDGKASVVGGGYNSPAVPMKTTGAILIPHSLGGCSVMNIGDYAFHGCRSLTSVTIPNSVTNIGSSAFYSCSGLTSVMIPNSVTSIRNYAFYGCSGLTSVMIPDSVTSIGSSAFSRCSGLTSVMIPDSVTSIGTFAFSRCSGLTSVAIPDSVTSIGENAFDNCSSLTSVTISVGMTSIERQTFYGCSSLTSVAIPDSVTSIGENAFHNCSSLTNVMIGVGVTSIGKNVFNSCSGLTSVTIPDSVTGIGDYAFNNCGSLTSVTIPDSVTSIGASAFLGCSSLKSVTIPHSVTSIRSYAFQSCSSLTSVTIGNGVTSIGEFAFRNCGSLASITIGNSVTSIVSSAFAGCSGLGVVTFLGASPRGLSESGISAKYRCPRQGAAGYFDALGIESFGGFIGNQPFLSVQILSSAIRENDPTVMDVVYEVTSASPTVKVRTLAFEDGDRSFAKVVRPETFVNDIDGNPTAQNVGDNIEANVPHKLSWKVSGDWATRLAKVKFEILALDGELLPLELRTIPANDQYSKMQISWNLVNDGQVFDALMWLYADKDAGLTLTKGVLQNGSTKLASGTGLISPYPNAVRYVFLKMGFDGVLSGAMLNYVNEETRLGLSPSGVRQYAYKIVSD